MPFLMLLLRRRLQFLPIATAIFIMITFIVCYTLAVTLDHVEPDFPYISHTAIKVPERSVFAQLVNIGAFMLGLTVIIRSLQMAPALSDMNAVRRDFIINKASAVVGVLSALGLTFVANFQTKEMKVVHYIGAGFSFLFGVCYCWMQTALSLRNLRRGRRSQTAIAQLIISIVLTFCFITFVISKTIYRVCDFQGHGTKHDTLREVYLVSTISEWLTAVCIVNFAITFYPDFKAAELILPRVRMVVPDYVDSIYIKRPSQAQIRSQAPRPMQHSRV